MNNKDCVHDIIRQLSPGNRSRQFRGQISRYELPLEFQKYLHVLGPTPKRCLETLTDLGLSDADIARYYNMPRRAVTDLRQIWKIDGIV